MPGDLTISGHEKARFLTRRNRAFVEFKNYLEEVAGAGAGAGAELGQQEAARSETAAAAMASLAIFIVVFKCGCCF